MPFLFYLCRLYHVQMNIHWIYLNTFTDQLFRSDRLFECFCSALVWYSDNLKWAKKPKTNNKEWWLISQLKKINEVVTRRKWQVPRRFGKYSSFGHPVVKGVVWSKLDWQVAIKELTYNFERALNNKSEQFSQ